MLKIIQQIFCLVLLLFIVNNLKAQTYFETATDDATINLADSSSSQIKLSVASTAISYSYNYISNHASSIGRFIGAIEIKAKPNDDGLVSLIKSGELEPGINASATFGFRVFSTQNSPFFTAIDVMIKPSYSRNGFTIYDSLIGVEGKDPVYKTNKNSFALDLKVNGLMSPNIFNIYYGAQVGPHWTNNSDDLDDGSIQSTTPYAGDATQSLTRNQKTVKYGQLEDVTKYPLKFDLMIDPGFKFGRGSDTKSIAYLGLFGYFRKDNIDTQKSRIGFGLCLLNAINPSKIYSSLGYEVPTFGSDVKEADRAKDKGQIFFTIGYSIL